MLEEDTIAYMKVSLPRPQKCIKILKQDSIQERFKALDISRTLLQKSKSALTKLSGAAAFLNHPEQSQHQDRVTLHYRITTRLDLISQRLLQEVNFPSVINETTATHVIIGVCYGAQAVFVFDDTNERISTERHAEMENILKKITTTPNTRNVFSSLTETEKTNSSYYCCSLYSDVGDWKSPVSFNEALEICESLPTVLGSKGEKAVPLKVWLYPLKKLDKSFVCAALSGVSENSMQRAENILEHLRKRIRICQDMITDYINVKVIMWFPAMKDKLIQFAGLLQEYKTYFHRRVAEIGKSTHMAQEEQEKSLQVLFATHDHSQFSEDKTTQWLENKETEIKILNDCRAADITVVKSQAELQQVISHSQITRVMCLKLFSPDSEDLFLTALRQHIDSDQTVSHDSLPLKLVCINQKVDVQLFIADKEANEDTEQTKFIAALVPDDDCPEYSVQFYHNGRIESRNVKLGIKPNLAQIVQMQHTSVSLMLNQAQTKGNVRYVVEYRALGDDGKNNKSWNQIIFDDKTPKKICMISDLKSGHQYQLRYSVVEQDFMSNFSKIMNFKTAVAATPGQPSVNKPDRDTLRLSWLKAETDEDCPVLFYMVEYKEAGLKGWSSVQTQGPECECTLVLPHSTCYRVRVSAVYEDITSQSSEETPVPVDVWIMKLTERKSHPSILLEELKLQTEKKPLELIDWPDDTADIETNGFLQCLPYISQLRFVAPQNESTQMQKKRKIFIIDLCLQAALHLKETIEATVQILLSSVNYEKSDFLLDLYSHVKDYETQKGKCVLPILQPVYQSAPDVWIIDLSQRKSSILLEVLKLQTEKKPVELIDWTYEESEVKGFLQCLPYISQLRFDAFVFCEKKPFKFLLNLIAAASEFEKITRENYTERLTSVCSYTSFPFDKKHFDDYKYNIIQSDFLLDLYSHVKNYDSQTGRSVIPALQPIYQSAPDVWIIKLSERKSSIFQEVLKLQTEKKPAELMDFSDDNTEVNRFLQCLPYISQLRFYFCEEQPFPFLLSLIFAASEFDEKTGGKYTDLLTSVCRLTSLPFDLDNPTYHIIQCDFLLGLWSNVKDYEIQTGRSVLPALQPIYQSTPDVWRIKLSEEKSSILQEVLKLQTEKKPVELIDWTDEDIVIKRFLQCLPYISQLRFAVPLWKKIKRFILDLCLQAALQQNETIEATVKILLSPANYEKSDFLLDLYSHMMDYENQTGTSVLPELQPVYQSAPAVWKIKLSERKSSILLEVLKLQTEKKPVELIDWTEEESEVKGFLQCLPYISGLRFVEPQNEPSQLWNKQKRFILDVCLQAALHQKETIEATVKILLSSVNYEKSDFLLDLWSNMKDFESQKGKSVFSALRPVFKSAPDVWIIDLSQRKSSFLEKVLKLQKEKKPVELRDWADESIEVKEFLRCLPHISQLRFVVPQTETPELWNKRKRFILDLCLQAALHQKTTIEAAVRILPSSVNYEKSDFLLDLYSHVKDHETQTGKSAFPALQPIYQSAPAVWKIKLSERKSSILLALLKLQAEKKPVELIDWTDEESEVKEFLQCLPYISQLRSVLNTSFTFNCTNLLLYTPA
ncbi:Neoverrucotoxin subunit alpha [Labeo rohita]|uniref:Neoverrucotoxin subunit alpha n=1 Tax=Labeo rohita TaxID=84645 RepID=A0ABQ8L273_LABRO|nr:Neoverrucotoxin subunit alpha [Labeo rohita]